MAMHLNICALLQPDSKVPGKGAISTVMIRRFNFCLDAIRLHDVQLTKPTRLRRHWAVSQSLYYPPAPSGVSLTSA